MKDANVFGILFPTWQAQEESKLGLGTGQGWEKDVLECTPVFNSLLAGLPVQNVFLVILRRLS